MHLPVVAQTEVVEEVEEVVAVLALVSNKHNLALDLKYTSVLIQHLWHYLVTVVII
jgi:hypothetical protein